MTIFNSDGSLAKTCGNGIRCAALSIYKYEFENHNKQLKQSELASAKIIGHSHKMKVVTKEWLEECLTQGALIGEEKYMPELHQQG